MTTTGDESPADDTGSTEAGMMGEPAPTWYQDVAPIVVAKCAGCHRDGGIAPFSLEDYEAAEPWATILADAIDSGSMPPFAVAETEECSMNYGWQDDLRLTDEQKQQVRAWADGGAPAGDPASAVSIPEPPSTALAEVDTHLEMQSEVTIEGTQDQFLCFSLDPGLTEDRFLRALQITPGNPKVVHHVLIYVDADAESAEQAGEDGVFPCSGGSLQGDLIGTWAPGMLPTRTPEGVGMQVPAGARLVMNVHYHPTGAGAEVDAGTGMDIDWLEERPAWAAQLALIGNGMGLLPGPNDSAGPEFRIPPGVADHTESMAIRLSDDIPELRLWEIGAHMHYVGVDMIIGVERSSSSGPAEECLMQTPTYSFEWQRLYAYDVPLEDAPRIQGGDQLFLRCTYNNTLSNPGVIEALSQQGLQEPVEVRLGEETLDEMCLGVFGIAFPNVL